MEKPVVPIRAFVYRIKFHSTDEKISTEFEYPANFVPLVPRIGEKFIIREGNKMIIRDVLFAILAPDSTGTILHEITVIFDPI